MKEMTSSTYYQELFKVAARKYFNGNIAELMRNLQILYNGYSWTGKLSKAKDERVYNPLCISKTFSLFLDKFLQCRHPVDYEDVSVKFFIDTGPALSVLTQYKELFLAALSNRAKPFVICPVLDLTQNFDVDQMKTFLLMAGYLTIDKNDGGYYTLAIPNAEVCFFHEQVMKKMAGVTDSTFDVSLPPRFDEKLYLAYFRMIRLFFAKLPYGSREKPHEISFERLLYVMYLTKYYHNKIVHEKLGADGRCDLVITIDNLYILVIELKRLLVGGVKK